jgi:hypothetical protein
MLRMIIKPESNSYVIDIPKEYINTEVEILVLPFTYDKTVTVKNNNKNIFEKTSGILKHKNIDPVQWQKDIRSEYER